MQKESNVLHMKELNKWASQTKYTHKIISIFHLENKEKSCQPTSIGLLKPSIGGIAPAIM